MITPPPHNPKDPRILKRLRDLLITRKQLVTEVESVVEEMREAARNGRNRTETAPKVHDDSNPA